MTLQELKNEVLKHVSVDWVRENCGKLTLKQTWIDAYDRCSEFIAKAADNANAIIAVATPVVNAVWQAMTIIWYWFKVACYFTYFAGQAVRQWWETKPVDKAQEAAIMHRLSLRNPLLASSIKIAA